MSAPPEEAAPSAAPKEVVEAPVGKPEERPQVEVVELDGLVLLKVIRHCKESLPSFVTGQLLGLDIGRVLEVTNCFPFPSRDDAEYGGEDDKDGAEYQVEMMRCLRNVNVDNNTVGWYQSTHLGSYMTESCLEHQFHYQENIRNCVVLVFDPMQTTVGNLELKAFRLTDEFMALYREKQFTPDALAAAKVSSTNVFQELPIKLHNSHVVMGLLLELEEGDDAVVEAQAASFEMSGGPYIEKHVELLIDCMDELSNESYKLQFYERNVQRQKLMQQQAVAAKRKADGGQRTQGEFDEELSNNPAFKPIQPPNRLEALLVANQISHHCEQVNKLSAQGLGKLYLLSNHGADAALRDAK
ncbi:hypothetical protein KFE25_006949 [Diacronema lutheri]|uniref:Eukaryotic translation initiation factor 3 subunit H n=2 Tax=Diacronema lutheri TaxID=2081491 RepID=A0A8J5XT31_DIALT|nr:hypothetical protein KFE25_006949 [Diacronema lutheri]